MSESPLVAICMGSDSDWPVMQAAAIVLEDFGVAHQAMVLSAHRMPREMVEFGSIAAERGFKVVIASSFGDIFYSNSLKNGLLPIRLPKEAMDVLFDETLASEGYRLDIDLAGQKVTTPSGRQFDFDIEPFSKHCLMNGLDEIGLTLQHADDIRAFETKHRAAQPWLFL